MTKVPLPRNVRLCSLTLGVSAGLAVLMLATILVAWRHFEAAAEVYRSAALSGGMGDPLDELQWIRSDLGYDAAVVAAMALVTAGLAPLIRRPLRWARVATWCTAVVLGAALLVELGGGPDAGGPPLDPGTSVLDGLRFELLPQWFPGVNAVLGFAVLVLVIASAVLLMRSSVSEFYRPAGQQQDPQWAAFRRAQNDRIAGDGKAPGQEGS